MVSAIILAAGSSRRMGQPKALLDIGGKTFLQHIVDVLNSARVLDIVIVLGSEVDDLKKHLGWFGGKVVLNERWQEGQLSSLVVGLDGLDSEDVLGAMICPIDHPVITQSLVVDLLQEFWTSKKKIIIPTFRGKRGHPVIFERSLFDEIRTAPMDVGARAVVHHHADDIAEVSSEEEGVIVNIDTPEDYKTNILHKLHD